MKLMTFQEIQDLENGQQVSSFQGTIKKVFDQKSDVGQYGQWWLQNIILQDDHANELTVTWTCEDAWSPKDEGKQLLFESGFDKKDQLVGLKREIKKKGTKVYESVKVDDRAKVKTYEANPLDEKGEYEHLTERIKPDPDWPEAHSHPGFHVEAPVNAPESSVRRFNGATLDQRQLAIIRQHSQSMALEVLKLKGDMGQLSLEDLTPAKLKSLADYFDNDVLGAAE